MADDPTLLEYSYIFHPAMLAFRAPRAQLVGPSIIPSVSYNQILTNSDLIPTDSSWPEPEGDFSCTSSF